MPRLQPRPTRNSETVALSVLALRSFARGNPATPFEVDVARTLSDLRVSQAVAQRLVASFDRVSTSTRLRLLGPLGASDAQMPADVQRGSRNLSPPGLIAVARPALRLRDPALPPGEQVLAPERFGINYRGMYCVDETGFDGLGSDEIYVVTSAVHITPLGENVVETVRHPLDQSGERWYGDVDSYNGRIGPVASCWNAPVTEVDAAMSLTTIVFEHDEGDPDAYRDEVDAAVKLAIGVATYLFPAAGAVLALIEASGLVTDFFNWLLGTGDDEVGTVTTVIELSELEIYSRTRPTEHFVTRVTAVIGQFGPVTTTERVGTGLIIQFLSSINDNDYLVGYQVSRQPRAPFFENEVA